LIPPYKIIDSEEKFDWLLESIKKKGHFAFDTESRGLPWHIEPLICISFCLGTETADESVAILPIWHHDPKEDKNALQLRSAWKHPRQREMLSQIFENSEITKAAHNIKYDVNVMRKWCDIEVKGFFYDTMLMHHILNEKPPHGLEHLLMWEFDTPDYSSHLHAIVGKGKKLKRGYDHIPDKMMWDYTAMDVEGTFKLCELYKMQFTPELWKLYCEEAEKVSKTLAKAEWYGHQVDMKTLDKLISNYETEQQDLLADIKALTYPDFNPSSTKQLLEHIQSIGYGDKIRNKKNKCGYSVDDFRLKQIQHELPLADLVLRHRKTVKMLGTYLYKLKKEADDKGRIRFSWLIHGTRSGRLSCPLLHQLPRSDKKRSLNIKDAFIARDGHTLVYFDYQQLELHVLACNSQDQEMLRILGDPKGDIHRATAQSILEVVLPGIKIEEVSDFNRQNCGKNVAFGTIYGSEGYRLVQAGQWEDLDGKRHSITWDMLNNGMDNLKSKFTAFDYLSRLPAKARKQNGTWTSNFGRMSRLGADLSQRNEYKRKHAERVITNFSVQSPAGGITIRTLNKVDDMLNYYAEQGKLKEEDCILVNTVHDSGVFEVKNYLNDWFIPSLKDIIERPIEEFDGYRFPANIGIGKTLSEAESNEI
jgi:DNA polymerase-1